MKAVVAVLSLVAVTAFPEVPLGVRAVAFLDPDSQEAGPLPARVVVLAALADRVTMAAGTSITLDVRLLGPRNRVVASSSDTFDGKAMAADFVSSLTVPRGRYRAVATLSAGDLVATGSTEIDIPDFTWAALSMSDVVFSSDERHVMLAEAARGLMPVAPVARHEFRASDRVSVFTRLYAGRSVLISPVTLTATIARDGQRPVFTDVTPATPARPTPLRTADYRLWLPLDQLGAGEWTLVLRARSADRHTVSRQVTFRIGPRESFSPKWKP